MKWFFELVMMQRHSEPRPVRTILGIPWIAHRLEPSRERRCVTMIATGRDFSTPGHGIPSGVGPFDTCLGRHESQYRSATAERNESGGTRRYFQWAPEATTENGKTTACCDDAGSAMPVGRVAARTRRERQALAPILKSYSREGTHPGSNEK